MQSLLKIYLTLFHIWMRLNQKVRFLLVGGYNTVFSYFLYAAFLYFFEIRVQLSLFLAYAISSVHNYLTQKFYVFNTRGSYLKEYLKCVIVWLLSYGLNAVILYVLTAWYQLNPYGAQVVSQVLVVIFNYVFLKYFAFSSLNAAFFQKVKQLLPHRR